MGAKSWGTKNPSDRSITLQVKWANRSHHGRTRRFVTPHLAGTLRVHGLRWQVVEAAKGSDGERSFG